MEINNTTRVVNYYISSVNSYNADRDYHDQIIFPLKRIQRLTYLFEILHMNENHGKPFLTDDFYAWPSGPVIPRLYYDHMNFGSGSPKIIQGVNLPPKKIRELIDYILELTKDMDTVDIEKLFTHRGSPWYEVRYKHPLIKILMTALGPLEEKVDTSDLIIPKRKIYKYYKDKKIL